MEMKFFTVIASVSILAPVLGLSAEAERSSFWEMMSPYFEEERESDPAAGSVTWYNQLFEAENHLSGSASDLAKEQITAKWTVHDIRTPLQISNWRSLLSQKVASYYACYADRDLACKLAARLCLGGLVQFKQNDFYQDEGYFAVVKAVTTEMGREAVPYLRQYGWLCDEDDFAHVETAWAGYTIDVSNVAEELCSQDPANLAWLLETYPELGRELVSKGAARARVRQMGDDYVKVVMGVNTNFHFNPSEEQMADMQELLKIEDPKQGLDRLRADMPWGMLCTLTSLFAKEWIELQPREFLQWYDRDNHFEWLCNVFKGHYIELAIDRMALQSEVLAVEAVAELSDPRVQSTASRKLFRWLETYSDRDPTEVLLAAGVDWLIADAMDLGREDAVSSDPDGFLDFLLQHPEESCYKLASQFTIRSLLESDPEAYRKQVSSLESKPDQDSRIEDLLVRSLIEKNLSAVHDRIAKLPERLRGDAVLLAIRRGHRSSADAMSETISLVPEGEQRDDCYTSFIGRWAYYDPAGAMRWVLDFPDAELKASLIETVRERWQRVSPVEVNF